MHEKCVVEISKDVVIKKENCPGTGQKSRIDLRQLEVWPLFNVWQRSRTNLRLYFTYQLPFRHKSYQLKSSFLSVRYPRSRALLIQAYMFLRGIPRGLSWQNCNPSIRWKHSNKGNKSFQRNKTTNDWPN